MTGRRHNPHFQKILVGYDGSSQSDKAIDVALSLAACIDCTVLIFAVARPLEPSTSVELEAMLDDAREPYEEELKKIMWKARGHELSVTTDMAVGHPAERMIEALATVDWLLQSDIEGCLEQHFDIARSLIDEEIRHREIEPSRRAPADNVSRLLLSIVNRNARRGAA